MPKQALTNDQILAWLNRNAGPAGQARARQATNPKRYQRSALVNTATVEHNTALNVRVTAPVRPVNTGGAPKRKAPKPASVLASERAIHWTR